MTYKYETHVHTSPVSACARATVEETVRAYHALGYTGLFITNHFIGANIAFEVRGLPYLEQLDFYYRDYTEAKRIGDEIGIDVYFGIEISFCGTDFIILGLDIDWYREHPEICGMEITEKLTLMRESGAFIIQAHPFREASYINHIRLFPRHVDAVEIWNSSRDNTANRMAKLYREEYGLLPYAGSDNHFGGEFTAFAGMEASRRAESLSDYIEMVRSGELQPFATKE